MATRKPRETTRPTWVVMARTIDQTYGIRSLEVDFRRLSLADAADDVADAIRVGRSEDAAYHTRRAASLRAATGDTLYYGGPSDYDAAKFTLHWQANLAGGDAILGDRGPTDWYAPGIDGGDLCPHVVRALAKLTRCGRDITPEQAIAALHAQGAVHMSDGGRLSDRVPSDILSKLVSPLQEQRADESSEAGENAA